MQDAEYTQLYVSSSGSENHFFSGSVYSYIVWFNSATEYFRGQRIILMYWWSLGCMHTLNRL